MTDVAAISFGSTSGRLLLQLARFLADPAAQVPAERVLALLPDRDRDTAAALQTVPAFAPALNAHLRRSTGLDGASADHELVSRLKVSDRDQVFLRLALAPADRLSEVFGTLAACICRGAISGAILGARVRQLRAAFGEDGFDVGLRQAALLFPNLADFADPAMTFPEPDPETGAMPAGTPFHIRDARIVLGRMMEERHPLFGRILDLRFGWTSERKSPAPPARTAPITDTHVDQLFKLLSMKDARWQMFSG